MSADEGAVLCAMSYLRIQQAHNMYCSAMAGCPPAMGLTHFLSCPFKLSRSFAASPSNLNLWIKPSSAEVHRQNCMSVAAFLIRQA